MRSLLLLRSFFFFNDTATTEIYPLSLHDALPIYDDRVPSDAGPIRPNHADRQHRRRATVVHPESARPRSPPRPMMVRVHVVALAFPVLLIGCNESGQLPEIKQIGVFMQSAGTLVEMPKLGTLGTSYGPRLYPELPDYGIPVVPDVGSMYVNIPDFPISTLKGIEWHGYRLGGNGSVGSPSTATPQDWKTVRVTSEQTKAPGLFKGGVSAAD